MAACVNDGQNSWWSEGMASNVVSGSNFKSVCVVVALNGKIKILTSFAGAADVWPSDQSCVSQGIDGDKS